MSRGEALKKDEDRESAGPGSAVLCYLFSVDRREPAEEFLSQITV